MKNLFKSIVEVTKRPRIRTRQIVASSQFGRKNIFVRVSDYKPSFNF
ncbi:MAG: hypothetical protein KAH32_03535 [Chlamydiia bacterium]|nr:hypothetical protein [Chlamydiia bacterium]